MEMTIEQKAQRIREHCLSIESGCDGCKLYIELAYGRKRG